jgi:hypothetical protein
MAIDTDQLKTDIETSIVDGMNAHTEAVAPGISIDYETFAQAFSPAIMLAVQALIDDEYPPVP